MKKEKFLKKLNLDIGSDFSRNSPKLIIDPIIEEKLVIDINVSEKDKLDYRNIISQDSLMESNLEKKKVDKHADKCSNETLIKKVALNVSSPKSNNDATDAINNIEIEGDLLSFFNTDCPTLNNTFRTENPNDVLSELDELIKSTNQNNLIKQNLSNSSKDGVNCNEIAEYLCDNYDFIYYSKSLYFYDCPIYRRLDDHEGKTLIKKILPPNTVKRLSDFHLKEILNQLKTTPSIQKYDDDINTTDRYIAFKNGVYDIKKDKILQHSSANYYFTYINVDYDPYNAKYGHTFNKYIDMCTGGDSELKELILQLIGYIISNSTHAKKIFFIVGAPDSGKTTFGEFLRYLIGAENCCSIPPQDLPNRFQAAQLVGKKLCYNMDIPDIHIKDTGVLKQLTGNDLVSAERKYETPFNFRNEAKLLYGCNNLPNIDSSEYAKAFFNRLVIIPFNKSIPPQHQDKDIISKLIKERNYIVNESIKALKRLIDSNYTFQTSSVSSIIKKEYIENLNTGIEFVNECCTFNREYKTHSSTLYNAYLEFCDECGYMDDEKLTLKKFTSTILSNFDIKSSKWRSSQGNLRGYIGIKLK